MIKQLLLTCASWFGWNRLHQASAGMVDIIARGDPDHLERNQCVRLAPDFSQHEVYCHITLDKDLIKPCDFQNALQGAGVELGGMKDTAISSVRMFLHDLSVTESALPQYNLLRTTIEELGFKNGANLSVAFQRAQNGGAQLCPWEIAPLFLLQHPDLLEEGEAYIVATEPSEHLLGGRFVFIVKREGYMRENAVLMLDIATAADVRWENDTPIIFAHPNNF